MASSSLREALLGTYSRANGGVLRSNIRQKFYRQSADGYGKIVLKSEYLCPGLLLVEQWEIIGNQV